MKYISNEKAQELNDIAYQIRKRSIEMVSYAGWGHVGGSLSQAEILASLYFHALKIDPKEPDKEDRDYYILSKAHTSPALYATLAIKGFYPMENIYKYCRLDGLDGHTDALEVPGIDSTGGSLGIGLSYSVGIALGLKMKEAFKQRVYCLIGDGETNEGQVWEAAMSASHYGLHNLIAVIDYNKVMAKGFVKDLMSIDPLADKWRAFGWNVIEVDGHDVRELCEAFYKAKYLPVNGKPTCIIAHTVKGKGVEECEFNYNWHTHAPSYKKAQEFLEALSRYYHKDEEGFDKIRKSPIEGDLISVIGGEYDEVL